MIGAAWYDPFLNALGELLAFLYGLIPNYGVAIILLTVLIRLVLLPLGVKQVRSMQAMQAVQPKVKELQRKHRNDKQKLNEEMMKLYREHGVNPLSGCLPLLLQFPVLIALFAVLRVNGGQISGHIPTDSSLYQAIRSQDTFLLPGHQVNLLCGANQAGEQFQFRPDPAHPETFVFPPLDCGSGVPSRIPYYLLAVAMMGTTFLQQRQMARASPSGSPQQQTLMKIMPLLFGFFGFLYASGLVLYWTTTNLFQIGQQSVMLRRGLIGSPVASEVPQDGSRALPAKGSPKDRGARGDGSKTGGVQSRGAKPGSSGAAERTRRSGGSGAARAAGGTAAPGGGKGSPKRRGPGSPPIPADGSPAATKAGQAAPVEDGGRERGNRSGTQRAGGVNAGDRKKRRKR